MKGEVDPELPGRLQSSVDDRNWDSIEALWRMKEEVKGDSELLAAFHAGDSAGDVLRALDGTERGRRFVAERLLPYRLEFGNKAIWSHEFVYPTWREEPAPIVEAVRGYLETDYDYPAALEAVKDDLDAAVHELMDGVPAGEGRDRLQAALDLSLRMNPLTPDHHFFIDQGTNARVRLVLVAIGRKLAEAGALDDPEDVMFLRYNELRLLTASPQAFDAKTLVSDRRDEREQAFAVRPPDWVGTATESQLAFPYYTLWGFPEKFHRPPPERREELHGLAASPGRRRGERPARVVARAVRRGARRRDPRLPDDEPGLGRPLHEDRRARHGRRRRGGASGRGLARVRPPRRRRHVGRHRAHQHRRPGARQRLDRRRRDPRSKPGARRRPADVTRLVDLSMPVHRDMLTFPRVPPPTLVMYESWTEFAERIGAAEHGADWLTASYLVIQSDHVGTHCDAVKHLRGPDAPGVEGIPLEYCYSDGVVLDFRDSPSGYRIMPEDVDAELQRIGYELKERDIVLIHTGAGAYNTEERYRTDHCGMTAEATRHLIAQGVRMMGIDAITFDPPVWAMFERQALLGGAPRDDRRGLLAPREPDEPRSAAVARLQAVGLPDQVDGHDGRARAGGRDPRGGVTGPLVWFDDEGCRDVRVAGGKGASLAAMTAAGLPVPPGFVVPRHGARAGGRRERA